MLNRPVVTFLLCLLSASFAARAAPAAYVLGVDGEWLVQGRTAPLTVGEEVSAGAILVAKDPHPFAGIRIVDAKTGAVMLSVRCDQPARCAQPIPLPASASPNPAQGAIAVLVEKALARMRRSPDRYVATISRSDSTAAESVLELAEGRLHLAPALARLPRAAYVARFNRLDCAPGSADCASILLTSIEWDRSAPAPRVAFSGRPGLYEVVVGRHDSNGFDGLGRAWVRIEAAPRYEPIRAAFAPAEALARGWGEAVDDATRASFLRSVLEMIGPEGEAAGGGSRLSQFEKELSETERASGPDSVAAAEAARALGTALAQARQYAKAVPYLERVVATRKRLLGDNLNTIQALAQLKRTHCLAGHREKCVDLGRELVAMALRTPNLVESQRAPSYLELAEALADNQDWEGARENTLHALAIFDRQPGSPSEAAVRARLMHARILHDSGKYEEANATFLLVLEQSPPTARGLQIKRDAHRGLSNTYWSMSMPESTVRHLREAVRVAEEAGERLTLARDRATLAQVLAGVHGQAAEAEAIARDVLAQLRPLQDFGLPLYADATLRSAQVLVRSADPAEAARAVRLALDAQRGVFASDSPQVASALVLEAELADRAGEVEESARILRRVVATQASRRGNCDSCLVLYMAQLADREEKLGNHAETAALRRRAATGALNVADPIIAAYGAYVVGKTHARAREWDAAIFHGKRALNIYQTFRARMAGLERTMQAGFVARRESTYRAVAGWMVDAGRLAEAQQVLDLLKDVELSTLVRGGVPANVEALQLAPREREAQTSLARISQDVVRLGAELTVLQRKGAALSGEDLSQRARIESQLTEARIAFDGFIAKLNDRFASAPADRNREYGSMQLDRLVAMRRTLAELGEGVVMLHYVVTPERLAIIVTTPRVQVARETAIHEDALNRAVFELRTALQDPRSDYLPAARRFYDIAIAPVAKDLEQAGAKVLMLSLDGTLRYVPFAALHDGEQFLAGRYATTLFTAAARDKLKDRPRAGWTMAGMGVTQAHTGFAALPAVRQELESIGAGRVYPGEIHLDGAFTAQRLQESLDRGIPLLHIASHFRFSSGAEADSFLLLGDGSHMTLRDIRTRNMDFGAVDLVTLSACETAMGGGRDESGREVEGLGALLQNQGAKGVMATLWPVADDGTARFMWTFYSGRNSASHPSKAEALRRAQMDFIARRGGDRRLAHPFYWAPFILMGNWL